MTTNLTALYGLNQQGNWRSQAFTTSGIWLKPSKVNTVKVLLVGAGGGGSGSATAGAKAPNGEASYFNTSPYSITARGGEGGTSQTTNNTGNALSAGGGSGGGAETHQRILWVKYDDVTNYPYPILGNGGRRVFATTYQPTGGGGGLGVSGSVNPSYDQFSGLPGIQAGDSISGAGGAAYYNGAGVSFNGGYAIGGSIPGYGSGGSGGAGGGASYGNGGSGRYTNLITQQTIAATPGIYGGGGAGASSYGAGGGGGEIVIKEIPITTDATIIIGTGGSGLGQYATNGGNGLCIIYWWE